MSKEAVVFVVDVSQAMAKEVSPGRSRLVEALEGVQRLVEAKLLQSKQNEIGVVLFGTHDTANQLAEESAGFEHVTVFAPLCKPPVSLLAELTNVCCEEDSADFINGLVVAVDLLHRRTNKKQYTRSLFLVTPAEDKISGIDDLEAICGQMIALETSFVVVGPGFGAGPSAVKSALGSDPSEAEAMEVDESSLSVKEQNEQLLRSIADQIQGKVMSATDMVSALTGLQCKSVRPTKNKCCLQFGDLELDVLVFTRTKAAAIPSLKQECIKSYDPTDPAKRGVVKQDRSYRDPANHDVEVPPEDLVSAYRYGTTLQPLTEPDLEAMKIETDKATLNVIGFTKVARIKPQLSIGEARCVIPVLGNARSEAAVGGIALALKATGRAAVARFVARKNAAPRYCALQHDQGCATYARLLMLELPFADDFRRFTFASLDPDALPEAMRPSEKQYAAAEALVDAMALSESSFQPESVFNPTAQRLRQAMVKRVQDPDAQLPPVDPRVEAYMNPSNEVLTAAAPAIQGFRSAFSFQVQEVLGKKRKHFWSDLSAADVSNDGRDTKKPKSENSPATAAGPAATAAAKAEVAAPHAVGSVNPVADFEAMLAAPASIMAGIDSMKTRILELVTDGANSAYYKKALQCLVALRAGCLAQSHSHDFNTFLVDEVKVNFALSRHGAFWDMIVGGGVTLITGAEDSTVDVDEAAAAAFLQEQAHASLPVASFDQAAEGSDEEIFDNLA